MGGKRPDQHNIDPAEAGATDYKNLPQTGRGHSNLDDTIALDKQKLAQGKQDGKGQPFLPDVPSPSVHANHGKKVQPEGDTSDDRAGAGNP
jgi:hypothetical protein